MKRKDFLAIYRWFKRRGYNRYIAYDASLDIFKMSDNAYATLQWITEN